VPARRQIVDDESLGKYYILAIAHFGGLDSHSILAKEHVMFDIFIKTHFAGAHHLREYPGDCEKPHGHNWKVDVTVRATELDRYGMGIDFKVLKNIVKQAIDKLDHRDLNTLPYFQDKNPSSEHISRFIYDDIEASLRHDRYALHSVTVYETDSQGLTYYGQQAQEKGKV
jgi:6-pyruvoyltetrahydropterin/6-carboxytetrahydropterin synthase